MINLITNNKTHFFREPIQLNYISDSLLPELAQRTEKERKIYIWSTACSTGEEPYTLAILLNEFFGEEREIRILASDVNTAVLRHAMTGIYAAESLTEISPELKQKYFLPTATAGYYQVAPLIRNMVKFRQVNLCNEQYPMIKTRFDLIFFRNVAIYFSEETIQALLLRFYALLKVEGFLTLGIAESLNISAQYYRKRRFNVFEPSRQATGILHPLILIGGSTGAVHTVERLIKSLPADTPGVVVAIHMPNEYSNSYAQRLDQLVTMQVKEACSGEKVMQGIVMIAPGDKNITLERNQKGENVVKLDSHVREGAFVPSVNRLFHSVSKAAGVNAIGVQLTGMGTDGAEGLLAMRQQGARTITQDKESSVVFGMPKAAIELNASEVTASIDTIPTKILQAISLVGKKEESSKLLQWKSEN